MLLKDAGTRLIYRLFVFGRLFLLKETIFKLQHLKFDHSNFIMERTLSAIIELNLTEEAGFFDVVFKYYLITCDFCNGRGHNQKDCISYKKLEKIFHEIGLRKTWLDDYKKTKAEREGPLNDFLAGPRVILDRRGKPGIPDVIEERDPRVSLDENAERFTRRRSI